MGKAADVPRLVRVFRQEDYGRTQEGRRPFKGGLEEGDSKVHADWERGTSEACRGDWKSFENASKIKINLRHSVLRL